MSGAWRADLCVRTCALKVTTTKRPVTEGGYEFEEPDRRMVDAQQLVLGTPLEPPELDPGRLAAPPHHTTTGGGIDRGAAASSGGAAGAAGSRSSLRDPPPLVKTLSDTGTRPAAERSLSERKGRARQLGGPAAAAAPLRCHPKLKLVLELRRPRGGVCPDKGHPPAAAIAFRLFQGSGALIGWSWCFVRVASSGWWQCDVLHAVVWSIRPRQIIVRQAWT